MLCPQRRLQSRITRPYPNFLYRGRGGTPRSPPSFLNNLSEGNVPRTSARGARTSPLAERAGPALVRVLFGDVPPSGKLVVSWPRSVGQEPLYYNALSTGRPPGNVDLTHPPYDSDPKYVSRYLDEQDTPQFPFGYGLSYTSLKYSDTRISTTKLNAGELNKSLGSDSKHKVIDVEASVTDTGSRAVDETVQLYVRLQGTSTAQPVRALKGFQHVTLAPGETKTVKFELGPEAFAFWTASNQFAVEPSKATIWISPDSARGAGATLSILP